MKLNMEYVNARKLIVPVLENVNLVLIGCGGTGSWLAPAVARYARMLTEHFGKNVTVTFVDPDKVEPKNIYRQNFCDAEVGSYKATTLANRYGLAWGVDIHALNERFTKNTKPIQPKRAETLTVLIGCVDTTAARLEIASCLGLPVWTKTNMWWLDCGNKKTVGQVLLGRGYGKDEHPLVLEGYCSWLPLPSIQRPELIDTSDIVEEVSPVVDETHLSCAELAMRGSQSLSINFRMASIASEMLGKLLLTLDLEYYAAYISEATGESRKFITDTAIGHWIATFDQSAPVDAVEEAYEDEFEYEEE